MTKPSIAIQNLSVSYDTHVVLSNITCTIPTGALLAIVGPNGAGKSTLLKTLLGFKKPNEGSVQLHYSPTAISPIAYVPQRTSVDWDFPATVLDVVLMGRYQHIGWFRWPSKTDYAIAHSALQQLKMDQFCDQPIGNLSGGQQQRVFLARALAQEAEIYLLDEPFVGVDKPSELTMMSLLKQLRDAGKTIVMVHHDLLTVADYFDQILLINTKQIAYGPVTQVLTPEYLDTTYGERHVLRL